VRIPRQVVRDLSLSVGTDIEVEIRRSDIDFLLIRDIFRIARGCKLLRHFSDEKLNLFSQLLIKEGIVKDRVKKKRLDYLKKVADEYGVKLSREYEFCSDELRRLNIASTLGLSTRKGGKK